MILMNNSFLFFIFVPLVFRACKRKFNAIEFRNSLVWREAIPTTQYTTPRKKMM
jgi:hypothetical protein